MRKTKHGLADLKQLRRQSAPAPLPAATASTQMPAGNKRLRARGAPQPDVVPRTKSALATSTSVASGLASSSEKSPEAKISTEDRALFRQAVKSVQRIKDTRRAVLPPVPLASALVLRQRRATAVGADPLEQAVAVSDEFRPATFTQDDTAFLRGGYGPDLVKNLKRGKWPIGATLDLHGDTLEQARDRLDRFLQSCLTHHIKCVRIVHGKGYGSKDGEPVLKQTIRRWLTQLEPVLAYAECAETDGGSGAVQVLLRIDLPLAIPMTGSGQTGA
jgi:DNA-nicking Smr family endonuclease